MKSKQQHQTYRRPKLKVSSKVSSKGRSLLMPGWEPMYVMGTMILDGDLFTAYRDPVSKELRWKMT